MPRTYVALDLETTGLDAERDAIIEVGAARFHDGEVLDTFSTFVNPGRHIPYQVTELTGIQDKDVEGAPGIHAVLPRVKRFVGDAPLVGHSVDFDAAFLRQHVPLDNELLDTFEFASVLLPNAERYSLQSLAKMLGIELENAHRALDDALASKELFVALLHRAAELPPRILKEIVGHGTQARWSAASFFQDALEIAARTPTRQRAKEREEFIGAPLFDKTRRQSLQPVEQPRSLQVDQLASLLETNGAFEKHFPGFEYRPQQVTMLRGIAEAFNQGDHLLVEAPTGVGKSLAYLIPAVYWAVDNGERVVVSTNTINLQEQLHRKDIPDLTEVLPFDFRSAVLKGRSHYLCTSRLQGLRRRGARTPIEARVLAKVLVWLMETQSGDGDELFLPTPTERVIWSQLSTEHEGCDPDRCRHFQQGNCFFYNARRQAEAAHVVIVNHALLLADISVQNRALPEYKYLIVDEAHHLESATTRGLSFESDRASLRRMLREIGYVTQSGRVTGMLSDVLGRIRNTNVPSDMFDRVELRVGKIGMSTTKAGKRLNKFFDHLESFVDEQRQGRDSRYNFRLRITSGVRVQPAWENVEIAWDDANGPLADVVNQMEILASGIEDLSAFDIEHAEELEAQILGTARHLEEMREKLHRMITQRSSSFIYWLESNPRNGHLSLHAAPLHVGPLVEEHLFHKKHSVILTSATLRTGGTFDFVREQLNAWDANEMVVGSPFDYQSSTLVYLVDDIPEPGQRGYQRIVAQGMAELFRATKGRALALFTSYSQLRNTLRSIRGPLMQNNITVQAQGEGISRAQLLETFRTGDRQVLLGTSSFWEGVDVPGDPLSCLAIAKLPFSVPSDPIFAARSETFDQPFFDYAVPLTILRFLQGFGRLIRTRTDRGIVVIFDKRLLTKQYGPLFIDSLPDPKIERGSITVLPRIARDWLENTPVRERQRAE